MPFSYIADKWRWSVFRGDTTTDKYNKAWWKLRCSLCTLQPCLTRLSIARRDLQGVSQPVDRTESDFDPGAVDYISKKQDPYIWTFVRNVAQFQFHKALCEAAGHQGPLHTCDIYNSTAAGDKLRAMLSKGTSEKWTVPFHALTGQSKLSVQPLKEYFQPLVAFLKESNKDDKVGWAKSTQGEPNGSAGRLSFLPCLLVLLPVLCL
ncbi:hypothetical protein ACOMHN_004024 [Nucella lapillus]